MSLWDYADLLPAPPPAEFRLTLGEGGTPLVRSRRIGPALGCEHLYFKLESCNPSGSYKDRFAVAALADLLARGGRLCLGTSSGNTGAALAAAAALAGVPCYLAIVETAPQGKLRQMLAYGAHLMRVKGFGLDAAMTKEVFDGLQGLATERGVPLQISAYTYAPAGMAGVQTISYELAEQWPAQASARQVYCPAGGGGLTLAVARGFTTLAQAGRLNGPAPAVHCVQPAGNDTIATPLRQGASQARAVTCTSTVSGLQVASVIDGHLTLAACRSSGGTGLAVPDAAVFAAQARLAREEGIFCEPAGATALAGWLQARAAGEVDPAATSVCLVTGSGFKDEVSLLRQTEAMPCPMLPDFAAFRTALAAALSRS